MADQTSGDAPPAIDTWTERISRMSGVFFAPMSASGMEQPVPADESESAAEAHAALAVPVQQPSLVGTSASSPRDELEVELTHLERRTERIEEALQSLIPDVEQESNPAQELQTVAMVAATAGDEPALCSLMDDGSDLATAPSSAKPAITDEESTAVSQSTLDAAIALPEPRLSRKRYEVPSTPPRKSSRRAPSGDLAKGTWDDAPNALSGSLSDRSHRCTRADGDSIAPEVNATLQRSQTGIGGHGGGNERRTLQRTHGTRHHLEEFRHGISRLAAARALAESVKTPLAAARGLCVGNRSSVETDGKRRNDEAPSAKPVAKRGGRARRSSNPSIQPLVDKLVEGTRSKEEDDMPQNIDDFVLEVVKRAKVDEQREEQAFNYQVLNRSQRFIISPDSALKRRWDWLVFAAVLVSILGTPLLLGFSDRLSTSAILAVIIVADGTWWVDICVTFRTAIRRQNTRHAVHSMAALLNLTRPSHIAWQYLRTYLTLDLVAGLPYYLILFSPHGLVASRFAGDPAQHANREAVTVLSLLPMLCLLRLRRLLRSEHLSAYLFADTDTNQLYRLGALFAYLSHALGCLYWLVCIVELRHNTHRLGRVLWENGQDFLPPQAYASFLPEGFEILRAYQNGTGGGELFNPELTECTLFISYLYALLWGAVNVSGVNFAKPHNYMHTIIALLGVSCAILTNAVIIGSVTTTLTRLNYARNTEAQKRQAIETHLRHHEVPKGLRNRVQQFYTFIGGVSEAQTQEQVMPSLPRGLAFQLDLLQKKDVFTKVPFFRDCTNDQIMDLVPRVARMFTMPGRTIIREGRVALGLYMIVRGRIRIGKGNAILNERMAGEFVGENSLLSDKPAAATCITTAFCELFLLKRQDFEGLVQMYPELKGRITFFALRKDKAAHQAACTKQLRFRDKKEQQQRQLQPRKCSSAQSKRRTRSVMGQDLCTPDLNKTGGTTGSSRSLSLLMFSREAGGAMRSDGDDGVRA